MRLSHSKRDLGSASSSDYDAIYMLVLKRKLQLSDGQIDPTLWTTALPKLEKDCENVKNSRDCS